MSLMSVETLKVMVAGRTLLDDLSLELHKGQVWGVLGENGVGKSSLLRVLAGLHAPAEGRVMLNGVDIAVQPRKLLAQRLGMLLQESPVVFPYTVLETIAAGRYAHHLPWQSVAPKDDPSVQRAIDIMGLGALVERTVDRLSGGERRRVAMATLIAQDPVVMLLDEPGNHLDLRHQMRLFEHVRVLAADHAKLLVLAIHDVNLAARYCSHLMLMYPDGRHEAGPTPSMLSSERLSLLYSQPIREVRAEGRSFWWPESVI